MDTNTIAQNQGNVQETFKRLFGSDSYGNYNGSLTDNNGYNCIEQYLVLPEITQPNKSIDIHSPI